MSFLLSLALTGLLCTAQSDKVREKYEQKRMQAPQNAEGQYKLGRWCERKGLKEEAIKAYERAIEIDPDHKDARRRLGHKKVLGRWVSEKKYEDKSWWAHPKVPQKRVDDAILKGMEYLLNQTARLPEVKHTHGHTLRMHELILLTAVQAGWDRNDRRFESLLATVLRLPLDKTYHVALRAMALAELDPYKYQQELAKCAQFFVDTQCDNGQWGYGEVVPHLPRKYPESEEGPLPQIETGVERRGRRLKTRKVKNIVIKKLNGVGGANGDNSNSQYAALGIRACLSGLVVVPKETIEKAIQWWEKNQHSDGGWGYGAGDSGDSGMNGNEPSWGSMTAGAVGGLAIYKYYLKRVFDMDVDWKGAPSIERGAKWMGDNLSFTKNPNHPQQLNAWQYYWYYAIERAGRLLETERFGTHEWYPEGALPILDRQQPDGSWPPEDWGGGQMKGMAKQMKDKLLPGVITETCFAILFLRRATPKLDETIKIKSGDVKKGEEEDEKGK